ncbi:MAG: drug/metabolite exporter YedA [Gemmatimonadaceae bacterium]|nr:drug/metabolite exporter YedA [Gemmatimonadaceae bacterium]
MIVAAFAAVYVIWGSTYLAIRFAIETLPPLLMAGIRFVIAGAMLYAWMRVRGARRPTRSEWLGATVVGALLLLGGNGLVVWSEQRVPSGMTALLVATVPLWMVLMTWLRPNGTRPTAMVATGVALGLAGLAILVQPSTIMGGGAIDPLGALVLLIASLSWAAGSLYSRQATMPPSPLLATAMEMLAGGALLILAGALTGEWSQLSLGAVSTRSVVALTYLVLFGSLVGFTAYVWLLRVANPTHVSTYAYVNPVIAVFLGWALADEPITPRTLVAAAIIVAAVGLITAGQTSARVPARARHAGVRVAASSTDS